MAAAYAALLSVMQILDQIKNHPRPPISINKQQVESLTENVTFLQEFLEVYDKHIGYRTEADALEIRIADAAHAAEDVIESHIVDRILVDGSSTVHGEESSSVDFYQGLQRVIVAMELVKKEALEEGQKQGVEMYQLQGNSSTTSIGSSRSASAGQSRIMVGFDDILLQMLEKLTSETSSREIISFTGMGGIGKTTFARNIFHHQIVVEYFDIIAWVTISQEYEMSKILVKLLDGLGENLSQVEDVHELGYKLYQILWGRRYLIIMDDIWDIEVWDRINIFFPEYNNGSRIIITTRLSNLASEICDSRNIHKMSFLDEDNSWKLFCKLVFGEGDCPLELEGIGKKIVEGCKGLPLSISVVGGLLAKSNPTLQYWEQTAETLNSTVNLEDNEHCLQILYMSYNSLPLLLKPFFLYIGLFCRCEVFSCREVVGLCVAEGLVKPILGKSLEEALDDEYLTELIARNLIFISSKGKLNRMFGEYNINVHDLFRDLCMRESQNQKLFCCLGERSLNIPHNIDTIHGIHISESTPEEEVLPMLKSTLLVRSFCWRTGNKTPLSSIVDFRLLRVALVDKVDNLEDIANQVNLRFISLKVGDDYRIPSSISHFWNLQTLLIDHAASNPLMMPHEIWMMPHLRSVFVDLLCLAEPPTDCCIILENLHSLGIICNFKCSEEVVKRIPNVKLLGISYTIVEGTTFTLADYDLNNLVRLQQLEMLKIEIDLKSQIPQQHLTVSFPYSLKKLYLSGTRVEWDDMTAKIGPLPFLECLILAEDACRGSKWETTEGHFCSLIILYIYSCSDLEYWMTESTHFPCLESLSLTDLSELNEIPSCIGDIPTLQLITVKRCSDSVCDSAERMKEEQEELGNDELQVQVHRSRAQRVEEVVVEEEDNLEDGSENEYLEHVIRELNEWSRLHPPTRLSSQNKMSFFLLFILLLFYLCTSYFKANYIVPLLPNR